MHIFANKKKDDPKMDVVDFLSDKMQEAEIWSLEDIKHNLSYYEQKIKLSLAINHKNIQKPDVVFFDPHVKKVFFVT